MATAVLFGGAPDDDAEADDDDDASALLRTRSPRIMASGWMMDLPPSMMFCVPTRLALRETLFPVSFFVKKGGCWLLF
jgi:hypothetical protein